MKMSGPSIDSNKYQVFLLASRAHMPLSFAVHPWFVVNKKGDVSRWEILHRAHRCDTSWGHLHRNERAPFVGIDVLVQAPFVQWPVRVIGTVSGDEKSLAHQMATHVESSPETYPFCNTYSYTGPNSNTYAQWVIDHFDESGFSLPWNAFGRKYPV